MQWLEYDVHTENSTIKYALRGDEQHVGSYFVDGYNATTIICYEFAGCFYHGCVRCHVGIDLNPIPKVPFGEFYCLFGEKVAALESQSGVRVVVTWKCEWVSFTNSGRQIISAHIQKDRTPGPETGSLWWTHKYC